jgi:hypothetical protein
MAYRRDVQALAVPTRQGDPLQRGTALDGLLHSIFDFLANLAAFKSANVLCN